MPTPRSDARSAERRGGNLFFFPLYAFRFAVFSVRVREIDPVFLGGENPPQSRAKGRGGGFYPPKKNPTAVPGRRPTFFVVQL